MPNVCGVISTRSLSLGHPVAYKKLRLNVCRFLLAFIHSNVTVATKIVMFGNQAFVVSHKNDRFFTSNNLSQICCVYC